MLPNNFDARGQRPWSERADLRLLASGRFGWLRGPPFVICSPFRARELKDREIAMEWDLDQTGIYIAVGYIGLLDEFAVFNRALTAEEVTLLFQRPGLLYWRTAHSL
jgi:hypothetical protein